MKNKYSLALACLLALVGTGLGQPGTLKWRYPTEDGIFSSPAIAPDGAICFASGAGRVYALNPDGTPRWDYQTDSQVGSSPAITADGTIYIGSDDHYVYALNPDGSLKWRYQTDNYVMSSPAIASNGTIYVGSDDTHLYALNPDGSLWSAPGMVDTWRGGCSIRPEVESGRRTRASEDLHA